MAIAGIDEALVVFILQYISSTGSTECRCI